MKDPAPARVPEVVIVLTTEASGDLAHRGEEGQVAVEVVAGDGRVVSVLSLVDQQTGDPTTLVLTPQ